MFKKLAFIISSTAQSLFKSEENLTIDSVLRNAKKSQYLYDGMYHITEELLKISDGTTRGSSVVLGYTTAMTDGEGEEMHLFVLFRRRLFYFSKIDDPEMKPHKEVYRDYEAPILLQLEFITRKKLIFAVKETALLHMIGDMVEIPEHLQDEWKQLIKVANQEFLRFIPPKSEERI